MLQSKKQGDQLMRAYICDRKINMRINYNRADYYSAFTIFNRQDNLIL